MKWEKPELIVLVRSKPEESVLLACEAQTASTGPDNNNGRCWTTPGVMCDAEKGIS